MSISGSKTEKHMSDQGNQHNNGPHQDPIFDNPSALCLAVWAKNQIPLGGGGWGWVEGSLIYPIGFYEGSMTFCLSLYLLFFTIRFTLFKVFQI